MKCSRPDNLDSRCVNSVTAGSGAPPVGNQNVDIFDRTNQRRCHDSQLGGIGHNDHVLGLLHHGAKRERLIRFIRRGSS